MTVLADHHGEAARQLAGPVESRFAGVAVTVTDEGAVTLDDGLAQFDTTIYREVEAGDHTIVLLRAARGRSTPTTRSPLVFHRSGFASLPPARSPR